MEGKVRMSATDIQANENRQGKGAAAQVQRVGRFLSAMIMPNIGAFVARGLITAFSIPDGWIPKLFPSLADWRAGEAGFVWLFLLECGVGAARRCAN